MNTLEEKILQYGLLAPDEQMALHLEIESRPQYATLLKEVQTLYQLMNEVIDTDLHHTDEMIAYLAAKNLTGISSLPASLSAEEAMLQEALDSDPAIARRYTQIKSQLALLAEGHDPVAQFEALSGHKVSPGLRTRHQDRTPYHGRPKESVAEIRRRWQFLATAASLVVLLILVMSVNRSARLAYLSAAELEATRPSQLRSIILAGNSEHTPESLARDESYLQSFSALAKRYAGAQERRFLVHYIYDAAVLPEIERKLESLADADQIPSELLVEVRYLLAKVYLAQGKTEEARGQLLSIQEHAGFKTIAIRRLLWQL